MIPLHEKCVIEVVLATKRKRVNCQVNVIKMFITSVQYLFFKKSLKLVFFSKNEKNITNVQIM